MKLLLSSVGIQSVYLNIKILTKNIHLFWMYITNYSFIFYKIAIQTHFCLIIAFFHNNEKVPCIQLQGT